MKVAIAQVANYSVIKQSLIHGLNQITDGKTSRQNWRDCVQYLTFVTGN